MNMLKIDMINQALNRYRKIFPCGDKAEFSDCFTVDSGKLLFWFNTEDKTTHVMAVALPRNG
ncbi:MAG: hypothetical protein LBI42_06665 [Chitinispirillales bacterium]|nr:hypothetical protein [Chitinispirillales bacterium]